MAYVYNPFTFGLDYTDRRILAPLEANIANLVIKTSANEFLSKQNKNRRNNDTNPRLQLLETANTALEATVYGNHAGRITVLETSNTAIHTRVDDLEASNTTLWEEVYDVHAPKITTQDSIIAYEQAKTQKISQAGYRGQINVLQADSDYKTRPEWIIFEGYFTANTNNEVSVITTNLAVTLQDVFDTWERFAFGIDYGSDSAENNINAFVFNPSPANTISCTFNASQDVGFISDVATDDYELEVKLTVGSSGDNDRMGVVIAYTIEPTSATLANHYYLVAFRNQDGPYGWRVAAQEVTNVVHPPVNPGKYIKGGVLTDPTVFRNAGSKRGPFIIDRSDIISCQGSSNWDGGGTSIRIRREGDIIRAWSSQRNSHSIDLNSEIVINLNDSSLGNPTEAQLQQLTIDRGSIQWDHTLGFNDGHIGNNGKRTWYNNGPDFSILEKFKGPKNYGFICQSQDNTTFDVEKFENYSSTRAEKFVFDLTADKVWVPDHDTGTYKHATTANLESELGRGRIIRDKTSNDVFYFNKNAEVVPLFRPGTIDHLTVQVDTLISLMSNTANQIANLYANVISGTPLQPL